MLPSRVRARAALESVLGQGDGPVLLTGDAGVGKTWLHRQSRTCYPDSFRWLEVDLTPSVGPVEFHRLILQGFGYETNAGLAKARGLISDLLVDASANDQRWFLILEEAHNAFPAILEEARILGNRLGNPDGFAGILLVGQNPLIRQLTTRSNTPIASRLAGHVHLRPLTVDEFEQWARALDPERSFSSTDLEQFHRALGGNPRRYLFETRQTWKPRTTIARAATPDLYEELETLPTGKTMTAAALAATTWEIPSAIPQKPPLQVADEMIEVGWDAASELSPFQKGGNDFETSPGTEGGTSPRPVSEADKKRSEERINDHYAALQAWTEWAKNQGREPVTSRILAEKIDVAEHDPEGLNSLPDEESCWVSPAPGVGELRSESKHAFAPYSQLFSRLKESRESAS